MGRRIANYVNWEPSAEMRALRDRVARTFDVEPAALVGRSRLRHVTYPRFAAIWVIRQYYPQLSWPCIGKLMGGRDHSTVIHGAQQAEILRQRDPHFAEALDRLLHEAADRRAPVVKIAAINLPERPVKPTPVEERLSARRVHERNRVGAEDCDAIRRMRASDALGKAIAASGGGFR